MDKEQNDKDALRRKITAQVTTTLTAAKPYTNTNPKPTTQAPERQPLKKAVRKIKSKTPTKEVTDVSDVSLDNTNKPNDLITKTEGMDLIYLIDDVLAEKLGWKHKGLISGLAKAKLFGGDVGGDVEMTSTPKSGNSQPPRQVTLFAQDVFTASPVSTNNSDKATPTIPQTLNFNTTDGQTMLANKISKIPRTPTNKETVFDPQEFIYNEEAGANLLKSTPAIRIDNKNNKLSPEAAFSPFVNIHAEENKTRSPLTTPIMIHTTPTMILRHDQSWQKPIELSDDSDVSDVSLDVSISSTSKSASKSLRKTFNLSGRKLLESAEDVARLTRENAEKANKKV